MKFRFLDPKQVEAVRSFMNKDKEFKMAAKYFSDDVLLAVDNSKCIVKIREGTVKEIQLNPTFMDAWGFQLKGSADTWSKMLQPVPPPTYQHLFPAMIRQNMEVSGNLESAFAHFWTVTRILDLLREAQNA